MKNSKVGMALAGLVASCALVFAASPALSKQEGKLKVKDSQKTETKENHGRQAGELPAGLQRHTEKKGQLPSGLQKKKDEDGQLTRGLEKGGKSLEPKSKGKNSTK
jgi:hypothetical protein